MEIKLEERKIYKGTYRDIPFEIVRSKGFESMGFEYNWCHYIYLFDTQVKQDIELPEIYFTAFGSRLSSCPDWVHSIEFHGGCTYCEIETTNYIGNFLKIGCDYMHYWDEGNRYDVKYVQSEAIKSIDSLYKFFGEITNRETLFEQFRSKFPGEGSICRRFDVSGMPLDKPDYEKEGNG